MEPPSLPPSSRPQEGYEGARNQPVTNLINQLTHIVMSRTLRARSEDVGMLVTGLQHKVTMHELRALPRDALKALKVTLKELKTQIQPDTHHEIITGISNLDSYLQGAISRNFTVVTKDNCQLKVDPEPLRMRSEYFGVLLSDRYREGATLQIHFDGTAEEFNELYLLCKLDEKELPKYIRKDDVKRYLELASRYLIPSLEMATVDWLADHLDELGINTGVGLVKEYSPDSQPRLSKWLAKRYIRMECPTSAALHRARESLRRPYDPVTLLNKAIEFNLPEWAPLCTQYLSLEEIEKFRCLANQKGSKEIEKWCTFVLNHEHKFGFNGYHMNLDGSLVHYPELEEAWLYRITDRGIKIDIGHWARYHSANSQRRSEYDGLLTWPLGKDADKVFPGIFVDIGPVTEVTLPAIIHFLPECVTGISVNLLNCPEIDLKPLFDKLPNLSSLSFRFSRSPHVLEALSAKLKSISSLPNLTELSLQTFHPVSNPLQPEIPVSLSLLQANDNKDITRLEIFDDIRPQQREFFTELQNYDNLTHLTLLTTKTADDLLKLIPMFALLPRLEMVGLYQKRLEKEGRATVKDQITEAINAVNATREAMGYSPVHIEILGREWSEYRRLSRKK